MSTKNPAAAHAQAHHAPDVKLYLTIFGALLVLTLVTVAVSWLHLPKAPAIAIGLLIASVKASLVAAFFMHLKGERHMIYLFLGLTVFFMAVLFLIPITDFAVISTHLPSAMGDVQAPAAEGAAAPAEEPHVP